MNPNALLVLDSDEDDLMLIEQAARHLNLERQVLYFRDGNDLIEHLETCDESPFLIVCEVSLPRETGFEIKWRISQNPVLKYKSVPFIFWSTAASERTIQQAYDLPAQGFFLKPDNFEEVCETLKLILAYWEKSQHPKKVT